MNATEVPPRPVSITVRALDTPAEMRAGVRVYREAFALPPEDPAVNPRLLFSLRHNAGSVIGAFACGRLIGFAYGFVGLDAETGAPYHYSQMAAVHGAWQGKGVGRALKLGQRDFVLSTGVTHMRWAYDPMRTLNAHFNLDVLGAVGRWFVPNMYGAQETGRDAGMLSDRLIVDWDLTAGVARATPGPPSVGWGDAVVAGDDVLVGVPRDWEALVAGDRARAQMLREAVATAFERLIASGCVVISCGSPHDDPETSVYRLTRAPSAGADRQVST
jgi:predicted GNAT superfamily acetyltransferase